MMVDTLSLVDQKRKKRNRIYLPETKSDLKFCTLIEEIKLDDWVYNANIEFWYEIEIDFEDEPNGLGHRSVAFFRVTDVKFAALEGSFDTDEEMKPIKSITDDLRAELVNAIANIIEQDSDKYIDTEGAYQERN